MTPVLLQHHYFVFDKQHEPKSNRGEVTTCYIATDTKGKQLMPTYSKQNKSTNLLTTGFSCPMDKIVFTLVTVRSNKGKVTTCHNASTPRGTTQAYLLQTQSPSNSSSLLSQSGILSHTWFAVIHLLPSPQSRVPSGQIVTPIFCSIKTEKSVCQAKHTNSISCKSLYYMCFITVSKECQLQYRGHLLLTKLQ